jgi:hypothetical protein
VGRAVEILSIISFFMSIPGDDVRAGGDLDDRRDTTDTKLMKTFTSSGLTAGGRSGDRCASA